MSQSLKVSNRGSFPCSSEGENTKKTTEEQRRELHVENNNLDFAYLQKSNKKS